MPPNCLQNITYSFQFDCQACGAAGRFRELSRSYADAAAKNARVVRSRIQCQNCGRQSEVGIDVYPAADAKDGDLEFTRLFRRKPQSATAKNRPLTPNPHRQ